MSAAEDRDWKAHRRKILAQIKAAQDDGQNVVWVAERNACPTCLAYQGHVVAPGKPFPAGLTYGDAPIKPYGKLVGPPLHPHCRCDLEATDLEPGSLDLPLAREAARSVARGLTDYASEPAKIRATRRLLAKADKAGLLPKSVADRARRNANAGEYKARPGSPEAKAEIAARRRKATKNMSRSVKSTPKASPAKVKEKDVVKTISLSVPARIEAIYNELAAFDGAYVRLAEVRARLADLTRAEQDKVLLEMLDEQIISISPMTDQSNLTAEDRAAAIMIGGKPKHLLVFI